MSIASTDYNLALNLLELGMKPLDRVVVQLPNVAELRHSLFRPSEDRRDSHRSPYDAPLRRN